MMMLLAALLGCGCDRSQPHAQATSRGNASTVTTPASDLPVLSVDAAHAMRETDPSMSDRPYTLKAARGLRLAIGSFHPSDPQRAGRQANAVRLLYNGSEYSIALPAESGSNFSCDLVAPAMKPINPNATEFTGFAAGKDAIIGIGYEGAQQKNAAPFKEFWVAKVIFIP